MERAAFPRDDIPNANPAPPSPETDPGTVGPNALPGFGDTHAMYPAWNPPPQAQAWQGWPVGWATPYWNGYGSVSTCSDVAFACLDLNASVLSTMPAYVTAGGAVMPAPDWLHNPSPDEYVSWEEFLKGLFWDYQMGEAFVLATARDDDGWPARFKVIPPWAVNVELRDGQRIYNIGSQDVTRDILHIRYRSEVGNARGYGPLDAGRLRVVAACNFQRYASDLAVRGGIPWGVITHPDELTSTQTAELKAQWLEARTGALGLPAVLSGGIELKSLQMDPKSMALIELSQHDESRICVLLGVPPFLMGLPSGGDSMTYSNTSQLFDYHWRAGLKPKAAHVMAALSHWLLPRNIGLELNRDEYVQPGLGERAIAYTQLHSIADPDGTVALTAAEIRQRERFDSKLAAVSLTGSEH